ncbi:MAG: Cell division-specific peptidoglycan biosynthesis regulator FtsW [candidate division WS6 bacterium GW2011_GWF2_39_15]|uniref:Probable peptidoglycan glycosyltransferase FtsW n=1 Tax=candidate division WS6 bacterium GW2011_GWF2_39_15 TaxID=1619100 RepID=A0A0G0MSN9_9BACT|nr:MAG: Cell division-specific peptidoglycan biosynthesis regulator FtsW [candidate division WS6 bacterium GW2011_GWF2_39_15]
MVTRKVNLKRKPNDDTQGRVDPFLVTFVLVMIAFGAVMIFDASVYQANRLFSDQYYFLRQHLIWILLGGALGTAAYLIPYKLILKLSPILFTVATFLLVAVLIVGDAVNGSKRWFSLGSLPIQPAEFIKPILIIFLAGILAKVDDSAKKGRLSDFDKFKKRIITFGGPLFLTLLLIIAEPDMGTTLLIGATAIFMFFLSDKSSAHLKGTLSLAGIFGVLGVAAGTFASYRMERVKTFFHLLFKGVVEDPNGTGYQIQQILIGIGSGGFWGKGFGQSRQRFGYLVENTAFTDSIFAVILEELGYIGGVIFVILWALFLWRILKLSQNIQDKAGSLTVAGIGIWLTLQTFLNMAANVGLIPLTGIPLPFFTYGGSNTIVTMIGLGLLLNVSRYAKQTKA